MSTNESAPVAEGAFPDHHVSNSDSTSGTPELTGAQQELLARMSGARTPYVGPTPAIPAAGTPMTLAERLAYIPSTTETSGAEYEFVAAQRRFRTTNKRLRSLLWQLKKAGGPKLSTPWLYKLAEQLEGFNRDLAGEVESAKQGRATDLAAARRDTAAVRAPAVSVVRQWVENETTPEDPGMPVRELYDLFYASCEQAGMGVNKIPTTTSWGRQLTELGYPSKTRREGAEVGKWRGLKPRGRG